MSKVLFRTRYSVIGTKKFSEVLTSDDPKDCRTKQEFKSECDINNIMARYRKTGVLGEPARLAAARFGDFSQVPTFMEMQEKISAAYELFAALPAAVRKQFDNDPGQFIDASETPEGRDLMKKLGLGKEASPQPSGGSPLPSAGQADPPGAQTPPLASQANFKSSPKEKSDA